MSRRTRICYVGTDPPESLRERFDGGGRSLTVHERPGAVDLSGPPPPDAVVSEYEFPDTTGVAFLSRVRADHPTLPFVLFDGTGDPAVAGEAVSAGVDEYVPRTDEDGAGRLSERVESALATDPVSRRARAIEEVADGIGIVDEDGSLAYVNEALATLTGADRESMVGAEWTEYLPGADDGKTRAAVRQALDREGNWTGTVAPTTVDGDRAYREASVTELDDGGYVCVIRDRTGAVRRERELAATKRRLEAVVSASPLATVALDASGRVERCNAAATDLFGTDLVGEPLPPAADVPERVEAVLDGDGVVGEEVTRELPDGDSRTLRVFGAPIGGDGGEVTGAVLVYEDVTAARERQRELAASEERYRTLVETSPVPVAVHVDGEVVYANDPFVELVGREDSAAVRGTPIAGVFAPADSGRFRKAMRDVERGECASTSEQRVVTTPAGEMRHVTTTSRPVEYDGSSAVLTVFDARTDGRRYERALARLHEYTREMLRAEEVGTAADVAVDAVADLLAVDGGAVFEFDADRSELSPLSAAAVGDRLPESVDADGGLVWRAFVEGRTRYVSGGTGECDGLPFEDVLLDPLGNHGVFVAGTAEEDEVTETTVELFEILAANLETALDRIRRQSVLDERDRRLARRTEELEQLNHLNTVIRDINRSLLDAGTPEEVTGSVCGLLTDTDAYSASWIGSRESTGAPFVPETDVGAPPAVTDWLHGTTVDSPLQELATAAIEADEPTAVDDVLAEWAEERSAALKYDFRSVVAVPVTVGDGVDRALLVHGTESEAFSDRELEVFGELGRAIAAAMRRVGEGGDHLEPRRTEVELAVRDDRLLLNRIADAGGTATLSGVLRRDGSLVGFVSTPGDPETMERLSAESGLVESVERLGESDGGYRYEVIGPRSALFETVAEFDARVESMTADGEGTTVVASLPTHLSVRSFVEAVTEEYPDTELRARREWQPSTDAPATLRERLEDACTERQFQALKAASLGGFYEWPRATTNQDLADLLDIASPTYQSHRRAAERELVSLVFDPGK